MKKTLKTLIAIGFTVVVIKAIIDIIKELISFL